VSVYDLGSAALTRGYNSIAKEYGAFHTGVEVYGREYWFGMSNNKLSTGITWHAPKRNHDHTFRETLSMGFTKYTPEEVVNIIEEMMPEWMGRSYNVLSKNCHSFSDELCRRLGVARLPQWVNTLANTGASTLDFFENTDSGYDGGEALFAFFDSMQQSVASTLWPSAIEPSRRLTESPQHSCWESLEVTGAMPPVLPCPKEDRQIRVRVQENAPRGWQ
jgi:hypothetical protein